MSKVDNRIVEMGFENKGFEKGIRDSQASLKDFDKSLTNMASGTSFSPLEGVTSGLANKFSLLGTVATGALLKIGSQAVVAGQQLLNSLGPQQIAAGFQEYELKINSIKVMLAGGKTDEGLPVTLAMVNEELERLNEYSDQTIYSFSDMTRNIGKFTNAGVSLPKSVQAIKGIANAAALSGANSEEAARAMYNFAQALSAGYVKLIDWKSIENANMATVEFKTQLLEAGVAAGTLEKTADGMYKVLTDGGMDEPINATKMFNQSLEKQWMTADVLTTTLNNYADATTDIGKRATEAATKVRTFKQLMDTTKEALGSGWAMTFEHIFGNFEEATELWTGINNIIGSIIQKSSDSRNDLLKDWKAFGGRIKIVDGLSTAWRNLSLILGLVKETFRNIFPPITANTLMKISIGFEKLMTSLTPSLKTLINIKRIFKGLFSALSLGFNVISSVFGGLFSGIKNIISIIPSGKNGGILGFLANMGDSLTKLNESAKKGEVFSKISKAISDGIGWIVDKGGIFVKIYKGIADGIGFLLDKIKTFFGSLGKIDTSGITGSFEKIREFFSKPLFKNSNKISEDTTKVSDSLSSLKDKLQPVKDFFSKSWDTLGFEGLINVFNGIVTGGIGIAIIKFFQSLTGLSGTVGNLGGIPKIFDELANTLKAYQDNLNAKKLLVIAGSIGILVASLAILTFLDQSKLLGAIGTITALFTNLSVSMILLDKFGGGVKASAQMLIMANSVLILTVALALLKNVNPNSIYALTTIIGELVLVNLALSKMSGSLKGTTNLIGMAMAISVIAIAASIFGKMDVGQLKQGIAAISILMGEMLVFSVIVGNIGGKAGSILAAGIAMGMISIALLELVGVVAILAQFNPEKLVTGLGGLAGIMGIVAIGMLALSNPKVLFGAAAMIILAAAITMFVPAIITLGSLPLKTIGTGLLAIAGIFAVLGLAGLILGPILPVMLGVAGAIALLGFAMLAAGTGMMLFGTGLALISAAGAGAIAILGLAIATLASLIPLILAKIGEGLVGLAIIIGQNAPLIMDALGLLITAFINLVIEKVPEFVIAGMTLILGFLQGIANNIGPIIETIFQMLINILNAITEKLPDLITAGADLIIAFLDGMGTEIPRVVDSAFTMVIDFINGLADSIEENTPLMLEAVANLATAFIDGVKDYLNIDEGSGIARDMIDGLIEGVTNGIDLVLKAVTDLGESVISAIKAILGIESPSKFTREMGEYLDLGLVQGLKSRSRNVISAAKEVGESSINALRSTMERISDEVDSEINSSPVITPVLNLNQIRNGANTLSQLLSTNQSYGLVSSKISDDKVIEQANQNGSNSLGGTTQIVNNSFNLNGVTIRSDADINKLAEELYRKQENAMRSRGIRPAYSN